MFNCEVCHCTTKSGQRQHKYPIFRTSNTEYYQVCGYNFNGQPVYESVSKITKNISREIKCCQYCHADLVSGISLKDLLDKYKALKKPVEQKPVPLALLDARATNNQTYDQPRADKSIKSQLFSAAYGSILPERKITVGSGTLVVIDEASDSGEDDIKQYPVNKPMDVGEPIKEGSLNRNKRSRK